jgi:hypothetical protein
VPDHALRDIRKIKLCFGVVIGVQSTNPATSLSGLLSFRRGHKIASFQARLIGPSSSRVPREFSANPRRTAARSDDARTDYA